MTKSRKQNFLLHSYLEIFLVVTLTAESFIKKFGHQKFLFQGGALFLENHEENIIIQF